MNTTFEGLKARNFFIFLYFIFYEQLNFYAQLSWARKKLYDLKSRDQPTEEEKMREKTTENRHSHNNNMDK